MRRTSVEDRFWSKVAKTPDCWVWIAVRSPAGYGRFGLRAGDVRMAHRFSWELANGPIPPGLLVCHRCDNRRCVRPDHLFLGTNADNVADKVAKGRQSKGEQHGRHKLTEASVRAIRHLRFEGLPGKFLAAAFGVSEATVSMIHRKKKWADLPDPPEFSERLWSMLKAVPTTGAQMGLLVFADKPGRRGVVVIDIDDWQALHGRDVDDEIQPVDPYLESQG